MVTAERRALIERYFAPKIRIPADHLDGLGRKILGAFEGPRNEWRTAWGIAKRESARARVTCWSTLIATRTGSSGTFLWTA